MKKIEYIRAKCNGCAVCEMLAPHIWIMNKTDGKADMLDIETIANKYRTIFPDEIEVVSEIVKSCSGKAISIKPK